jgi:hypothetical protein
MIFFTKFIVWHKLCFLPKESLEKEVNETEEGKDFVKGCFLERNF